MHIALLSYMRLRRTLIELMLARNPGVNQGVRYLLGSEAMRAGDHEYARRVFEEEADSYPPYFYELALSHMFKDEWVVAATALRRGFAANPYIAEILGGNPNPEPLAIWHGTSWAKPVNRLRLHADVWRTLAHETRQLCIYPLAIQPSEGDGRAGSDHGVQGSRAMGR